MLLFCVARIRCAVISMQFLLCSLFGSRPYRLKLLGEPKKLVLGGRPTNTEHGGSKSNRYAAKCGTRSALVDFDIGSALLCLVRGPASPRRVWLVFPFVSSDICDLGPLAHFLVPNHRIPFLTLLSTAVCPLRTLRDNLSLY